MAGSVNGPWQTAQLAKREAANAARADAMQGNDNAARTREEQTVPPQVVATLNERPTRNHKAESQRKTATALAKAIGVVTQ